MQRSGILCGGAWCGDRNVTVDHWPSQETVATILGSSDFGGCPGHNMSTALKRLGAPFQVEAQGLVGNDEFGHLLWRICDELGIAREALEMRDGIATSVTYAMTDQRTGKRTHFHEPGAFKVQSPDDFDFTKTTCRIAHLGLPGLQPVLDGPWKGDASGWVTVLKKAKAAGLKTNMELVSVERKKVHAVATSFLPFLDTIIINDEEAGAIAQMDTVADGVTNIEGCRAAAQKIMAAFTNLEMLVIHFPMGGIVLMRNGDTAEHASVKVPQDQILGSNGAGDCFAAGMLFGHHENWPIQQSLKLAHASAAMSLRSPNTTASVVPWKECLTQADSWGWRG
ncbi:carbohydrate kinase family protein [Aestuariivirga litoralis]|uniref:carbohydrate kinase family protein n=1 Tax=Aestuariivirga litoralis TaxID=2650924 RepID=UPI0018C66FD5|nr:carbohydrate kinase family protein [Aestuariivirga litoralis]MBG1230962.1 carbohydrate kinase family protein [Aestuariivirga litoralis]